MTRALDKDLLKVIAQNAAVEHAGEHSYLPDYEGKPVLASCMNCAHNQDVSDGPEYGGPYYACTKEGKEHMSYLKHWPFKTPQKCCELHMAYMHDWEKIAKEQKGTAS